MKTRIILLAALAVCACAPVKTDLAKYDLNCKAGSLTLVCDTLELPYTVFFNSRGQADSVITTNFDGSFRYRETYTYDSRGRLEEIQGVNAEGETEIRYEYEMDGRFVKVCRTFGMNNQEMDRWEHRNDGRHIVHTDYFNEGVPSYVTTKTFSGNSYIEESRTPEGELMGRAEVEFFRVEEKPSRITGDGFDVEIQYNDKGLPVMSRNVVLDSKGAMQWVSDLETNPCRYYSYEYDERGNWILRRETRTPDENGGVELRRIIVYQK